jgi:hypothetical protein
MILEPPLWVTDAWVDETWADGTWATEVAPDDELFAGIRVVVRARPRVVLVTFRGHSGIMSTQIPSGGLLRKDPDADEPFFVDWGRDRRIGSSVSITTSTWDIAGPDADLVDADPGIGTLDYTTSVFTASGSGRVTKAHFTGGTLGATYTVTNTVVTDETPPRTLDASFRVLIEQE